MKIRLFAILFFNMLISYAFAQEGQDYQKLNDPSTLKAGLERMAANTKTIQTSFEQKKYIKILSNALESEGKMFFKKPQALKWAYTKPYDYAILFKEKEIEINDEGKVSKFDISSSQAFLEINEVIVNSVSGNILQEKQFDISYFANNTAYKVELRPKIDQMKSYIAMIELIIDRQDFTVSQIKLVEKGDDYTLIDFFDKKLNVDIPEKTFDIN